MPSERRVAQPLYAPPTEALRFLPEGPYPLGPSRFSWVAIQHGAESRAGSLNLFDMSSGTNQDLPLPGRPGFAFPCDDGRSFVVGCERALGVFETATGRWRPFCESIDQGVEGTIINDGVVWEDNLIFGTKDLAFATPKAGLYLYRGRDRRLIQLRDDQICSNGKAVRRTDGALELIDIDTPTREVAAYRLDLDAGAVGERRVVLDLADAPGLPDGAILTPDGRGIIIALYNPDPADAGEARLYDLATGRLEQVWQTPGSPQVTCPQLVEHEGRVALVLTTAVEHLPPERRAGAPNAGSLFVAETDFDRLSDAPAFPLAAASPAY